MVLPTNGGVWEVFLNANYANFHKSFFGGRLKMSVFETPHVTSTQTEYPLPMCHPRVRDCSTFTREVRPKLVRKARPVRGTPKREIAEW